MLQVYRLFLEHFPYTDTGEKMVKDIFSLELAVGEKLTIRKNHIQSESTSGPRISIVTGIHGDEMEGQFVCYEIARIINASPEKLKGTVDIYPAANPMGLDMATRYVPRLDMDMNRMFPGNNCGTAAERVAAALVEDIAGSDMCVDVHSSDNFVREIPQVRLSEEFSDRLLPYAKLMNVDMIWVNASTSVHESTLAHTMNMLNVPTMVVEMGQGMRINRKFGEQVVIGIFNLMYEMGIWTEKPENIQMPVISTDGEVDFIRAEHTGVFLPLIAHNHYVCAGESIGQIINVLNGTVIDEIRAERDGLVFTLREYPFVNRGALIARILWNIE